MTVYVCTVSVKAEVLPELKLTGHNKKKKKKATKIIVQPGWNHYSNTGRARSCHFAPGTSGVTVSLQHSSVLILHWRSIVMDVDSVLR
jgi:hypothetical protein